MTTKVLVLAFNPQGTDRLKLEEEIRLIEDARQEGEQREEFTIKPLLKTNLDDLQKIIRRQKPRIVHFCGHGMGSQGLVFAASSGQEQLLDTRAIADLFRLFANQVECVVLNACYSQFQAAAINQHINYVVGTKKEIRDDAAVAFSKGFYEALFDGETIERAYEFGSNRIQIEIYGSSNRERKLVPVYSEAEHKYIEQPQHQALVLLKKDSLNQIISEEVEPIKIENIPSNLKKTGAANFVGREEKLEELHQLLQQNDRVTVSAIAGMGGIGKTELALQYAQNYQDDYQGSLCWFSVREQNLATERLGQEHPDVALSLNNLAELYRLQGRYQDAETLYLQALKIAEATLGKNHPRTNAIRENFQYAIVMEYLNMPEAEMKKVLPEQVWEQLLEYIRLLEQSLD